MLSASLYRKTLFRQPVRLLILIVLMAAAAYAFTSHAAESLLVAQETDALEAYYRPIGYLTGSWDVRAGQEIVSECPYLELEDIRRYATGLLADMQNADVDGALFQSVFYKRTNAVIFAGELTGIKLVRSGEGDGTKGYYELEFRVRSVEAAYGDYMTEGQTVYVRSLPGFEENWDAAGTYFPAGQDEQFAKERGNLMEGKTYLVHAYYYEYGGLNPPQGARNGQAGSCFVLKPLLSDGTYFYEVAGTVDYSIPELEELSDYAAYLRHNQCVMNVNGIQDMTLLPFFQESSRRYYIAEGRMLTGEDTAGKNPVCVIHENFARLRGLQVGDTLRLSLLEKSDAASWSGYANWDDWEHWEALDSQETEFEIVGIYNDFFTLGQYLSAYSTEMFIPASCFPEGYGEEGMESHGDAGYSFVLQKPEDRQRFLKEYEAPLQKAGYTVVFVENNADNFAQTAGELRRSSTLGTAVFAAVLIMTLTASCGLYLMQRRREYAVARALGLSARQAAGGLLTAFGWAAVPGVLTGCLLGWRQMQRNAGEIMAPLAAQAKTGGEASVSSVWLLLIMSGILAAVFLILALGISLLAGQPVLSLLRESTGAERTRQEELRRGEHSRNPSLPEQGGAAAWNDFSIPVCQGRHRKGAFTVRYIGKHILRARLKSLLPFAAGIGAVLLFGWMNSAIAGYEAEIDRLYRTTVIDGEILKTDTSVSVNQTGGDIAPSLVAAVEDSGLVAETYREDSGLAQTVTVEKGGELGETILTETPVLGLYEKEGFLEGTGKRLEVQFYFGYGWEYFLEERGEDDPEAYGILVPEQYRQQFDVQPGDNLVLYGGGYVKPCRVVGFYQENTAGPGGTEEGLGDSILMQGATLHFLVEENYYCHVARFTFMPEKNRELTARENELEEMVSGEMPFLRFFIWDEELHEVVEPMERTLSLFRMLYPAAIAAALALGFGFQLLLMLQRQREAAVMRVLGNAARTVAGVLGTEQILLCLAGAGLGLLCGRMVYEALAGSVWAALGLYVLGNLAGIAAGGIVVAKRRPLALLQDKD